MPEAIQREGAIPPPRGPVRYAWFDGIVEGKRDPARDRELTEITERLRALPVTPSVDLELDGGRFSVLPDGHTIEAPALDDERRRKIAELLEGLAGASADPAGVESTLRCTAVHDDAVVETLFGLAGGAVRVVARVRRPQPTDAGHRPLGTTVPELIQAFGRRRLVAIGVLLLAAVCMLLWEGGWLDRLFSAAPTALAIDCGPFGSMLEVKVEPSWGNYEVDVRRGPAYPALSSDLDALLRAAATPAERAAVQSVANGASVYAQLRDADGEVMAFGPLALGTLLSDPEGRATARLPGHIRAKTVCLALDPGANGK